ncbi:MAG: alpha/beta hydrolase-fold protein [Gemmatimonadetes bacterium]|nr:alpha/beta hydrolase-fold protein [Gemmatimonadota bacterium]
MNGRGSGGSRARAARAAAWAAVLLLACGADDPVRPQAPATLEWVALTTALQEPVNIAVIRPTVAARGVVLAFPWGRGDSDLLLSLIDSYWDVAAPAAGYAVVGVEVYGPGMSDGGEYVMDAVLEWIDANFVGAANDIVMTGASAGGIGVFHAALAVPDRVGGIIAMPGRYEGGASLVPFAGLPVWMMVGEEDGNWVDRSQATADLLEAAGADVTHEVLPAQGHVLIVPQDELVAWIEGR